MRGQQQLDGLEVVRRQARCSGTIDIPVADAEQLTTGKGVIFFGWARVSAPLYKETEEGDLIRIDVLKPEEIGVASGELRDELFDRLTMGAGEGQERLAFPPPVGPPGGIDAATGEIDDEDEPTPDLVDAMRQVEGVQPDDDGTPAGAQPEPEAPNPGDTTQQLGSVYEGRKRDPALERFMEVP